MIQQGTQEINLHQERKNRAIKWSILTEGGRQYIPIPITFPTPFPGPAPLIHLSVTSLTSDRSGPTLTYSLDAQEITPLGFLLRIGIDSISLTTMQVSWLALTS